MNVRHIDKGLIKIDKAEALRYMRYKAEIVDEETDKLLYESIAELQEISEFKYVYGIFNIKKHNNNISFENGINIKSYDLVRLFKDCYKSAIMAATIGFEVEKRVKYYSMTNLSRAVVFDACATSCIEALCDFAEAEIKEIAAKENCNITFRYSPGYGDVPITHQGEILSSLNAQKLIGLATSDSSILIPRKSVTAFIGFDKNNMHKRPCSSCNLVDNCEFKKGEKTCVK